MVAKRLRNQKEHIYFGKKNISRKLLSGQTREEYTKPWEDNCLLGCLYVLHNSDKPLTYKDIGDRIGWGWRTVKNKMHQVIRRSILENAIKSETRKVYSRGIKKKKFWWVDSDLVSTWTFNQLVSAVTGSYYKVDSGEPNKCEKFLLDILFEIQPGLWEFNGERIPENSIDGLYPDIINRSHKLTVDHFGERFHDRDQGEEEKRIKRLQSCGYKSLIIWENELKNRNKCKRKLEEFIIQNAI